MLPQYKYSFVLLSALLMAKYSQSTLYTQLQSYSEFLLFVEGMWRFALCRALQSRLHGIVNVL